MKASKRPPVVMIHGAFCGGWSLARWSTAYKARGFAVHAPTLRYHGSGQESLRCVGGVSIRDYCADLCALLEGFDSPPVIVGHSLGGLIAQMLAARVRLRALILLAPLAPWGIFPSTTFEWMAMQALYWEVGFRQKVVKPRHSIATAHALELVPEHERAAILQRLVPESGQAIFEAMHWMLDSRKTSFVDQRHVTCPILCLAGGRDRIVSPATIRRIARRYDGRARYELFPEAGHWLLGEPGWERIAAGSLNWLDQVLDRDSERV
jgi:pimeloyl-ACP methyl ester carboxylesterase